MSYDSYHDADKYTEDGARAFNDGDANTAIKKLDKARKSALSGVRLGISKLRTIIDKESQCYEALDDKVTFERKVTGLQAELAELVSCLSPTRDTSDEDHPAKRQKLTRSPFDTLPGEIMTSIFANLEPRDLVSALHVSRRWNLFVVHLSEYLLNPEFAPTTSVGRMKTFVERCANAEVTKVEELRVQNLLVEQYPSLCRELADSPLRIRALNISPDADHSFEMLLQNCAVESLTMSIRDSKHYNFGTFNFNFPTLKHLSLTMIVDAGFKFVGIRFTRFVYSERVHSPDWQERTLPEAICLLARIGREIRLLISRDT